MNSKEIVARVYRQVLGRKADHHGMKYYEALLSSGKINEDGLRSLLEQSTEKKLQILRKPCARSWEKCLTWLRYIYEPFVPTEIPKFGVKGGIMIVETRKNQDLIPVLKNAVYMLPGWSLHIFHSKENSIFVKEITSGWSEVNYHLLTNPVSNIDDYDNLMRSEWIWEQMFEEYILVIQPDTLIRKKNLDDFVQQQYDYVGAPWPHFPVPNDITLNVGNGGLSLRRRQAMITCIRNPDEWSSDPYIPEDVFFSWNCRRLGFKVPLQQEAEKFSVEMIYYKDPFGLHKPHAYLLQPDVDSLLTVFYRQKYEC